MLSDGKTALKACRLCLKVLAFSVLVLLSQGTATRSYQYDAMNREQRVELAKRLRNNLVKLREGLPTLSPEQRRWLESESKAAEAARQTGAASRYLSLLDSYELNLDRSNKSLDLILQAVDEILKPSVPPREEVLHWSVVASAYMSRDFWQQLHKVADRGHLDVDLLNFVNGTSRDLELNVANASVYSQRVLTRIVIPFLDGTLP